MENESHVPKTTARDFFMYLGVAITLYLSAGSFLRLLFGIINAAFPDTAAVAYYGAYAGESYDGSLRWAIASLLVIFPLYLALSWMLRKEIAQHVEKYQIRIRKWFVYLTLFLSGTAMAIDVVALINIFLGGELSTRFILKVLAVLGVAAIVFGYYLYDLRRAATGDRSVRTSFVWGAAALVLISIVGGFMVIGSPMQNRIARFDENKVKDLSMLQSNLVQYWQSKGELPATLEDLAREYPGYGAITDSQTGEVYGYTKGAATTSTAGPSFSLCATFNAASKQNGSQIAAAIEEAQGNFNNWNHESGNYCFDRTIDPDFYPKMQGSGMMPPIHL